MRVIVVKNTEEMGKRAAQLVTEDMKQHATFVLGLATGSTPLPLYKELIRQHKEKGVDFSTTITFNLDEYVGLPPDHPESYHQFMWDNLFKDININPKLTHVPEGNLPYQTDEDLKKVQVVCGQYEAMIDDVVVLTIRFWVSEEMDILVLTSLVLQSVR